MLNHLKLSGADVTSDDIVCAPCDGARAGGFSPAGVIVLCQDGFMSKNHMEDTMVHELVHMYDHAKFKVDWENLRHHACSEVRVTTHSCCWGAWFGLPLSCETALSFGASLATARGFFFRFDGLR